MPINRKLSFAALKVLVSALLLYFVLQSADWRNVALLLRGAGLWETTLAAVCLTLAVALNAVRWHQVLAAIGAPVPARVTLVGTFEGMFFNLFLPTSVGGDAVKAYRVFDYGVRLPLALSSVLVERALGLLALGLLLLAALPLSGLAGEALGFPLLGLSALIVAGGTAAGLVGRLVDPGRFPAWLRPLAVLVRHYGLVLMSARFLVAILPVMVVANLLTASTMWLIATGIGIDISFMETMIVLQASTLAALIPISFGGWGVREGTSVYLLTMIGVGSTQAVALSVMFAMALVLMGVIGAIAWALSPYRAGGRLARRHQDTASRQHMDETV